IEGEISEGTFRAPNTEISGLEAPNGNATIGFRAEDASVVQSGGQISAPIYTMELLGDATMVSVRIGGSLVQVKADKTYRIKIGDPVSIGVSKDYCHLFDSQTGARIGA
ncbi:MAG: TOBE domain-containing protein, partial [Rhodobacteraceae bacterium]|nr:TOBE domain-containing protein [Paracoccaceae bacterium]